MTTPYSGNSIQNLRQSEIQLKGLSAPEAPPSLGERALHHGAKAAGRFRDDYLAYQEGYDALEREAIRRDNEAKDTFYLNTTRLAQDKFDHTLRKELSHYYRSDGIDVVPPSEDFRADLGFGITLTRKDFYDTSGVRHPYTKIVENLSNRFMEARKKDAPHVGVLERLDGLLVRGHLKTRVNARIYQDSRQGMVLTHKLNGAILSYKEAIANERGFNPELFGTHILSMGGIAKQATELLDPGKVYEAYRAAITDLISVGVLEAYTDKDNESAIKVLAGGELANTETVRKAVLGLSPEDKAFLNYNRSLARRTVKDFKLGDRLPNNIAEAHDWAFAQLNPKQRAKLQGDAIKAFEAQTRTAKGELEAQLEGLKTAAFSPSVKDSGFRQSIKKAATKALADAVRLYPKKLFPAKRAQATAKVLMAAEAVESRESFDDVHTKYLMQAAAEQSANLAAKVQMVAGEDAQIAALPLLDMAHKELIRAATVEANTRQRDPYGSLIRGSKGLRELDKKLSTYDYSGNFGEKYKDQNVLKRVVMERGVKLGVAPSFLTTTDKATLRALATRGNSSLLFSSVAGIRDRYGDNIFFENVVPELVRDKTLVGKIGGVYLLNNQAMAEKVIQAIVNEKENSKYIKENGLDLDETPPLDEEMNNYIDGRFPGYGSAIKTSLRSSISALQKQYLADGYETGGGLFGWFGGDSNPAKHATQSIKDAIGSPISFRGNKTLLPPGNSLTPVQLEVLDGLLSQDDFLREEVYPYITPSEEILNKAKHSGLSVEETMERMFKEKDIIDWAFSLEGVRPVLVNPCSLL